MAVIRKCRLQMINLQIVIKDTTKINVLMTDLGSIIHSPVWPSTIGLPFLNSGLYIHGQPHKHT